MKKETMVMNLQFLNLMKDFRELLKKGGAH